MSGLTARGYFSDRRQSSRMQPAESSVVIKQPIEFCFACLCDLRNDVEWRREWIAAEKTSEGPALIDLGDVRRARRPRQVPVLPGPRPDRLIGLNVSDTTCNGRARLGGASTTPNPRCTVPRHTASTRE
jgi:hypothetical protein